METDFQRCVVKFRVIKTNECNVAARRGHRDRNRILLSLSRSCCHSYKVLDTGGGMAMSLSAFSESFNPAAECRFAPTFVDYKK